MEYNVEQEELDVKSDILRFGSSAKREI